VIGFERRSGLQVFDFGSLSGNDERSGMVSVYEPSGSGLVPTAFLDR
jgi:hypothetical protein